MLVKLQMNKVFEILIVFLSIYSCSTPKSHLNDRNLIPSHGLNANVKSIETTLSSFEILNDSIVLGQRIDNFDFDSYSLKKFNQQGLIIYEATYESVLKFYYDSLNKLVKLTKKLKNEELPSVIYIYEYDKQDSLIKVIYKNKNFERKMFFDRDNNNRTVKRTDYVNDTIQLILVVKYNNLGNIIEENTYLNKSQPLKLIKRNYDGNLLITENIQEFSPYDTLVYKNIYKYNNNLKVVEIKSNYVSKSDYTEIIKNYDSKGKLIMEQWIPIGSSYFVTETQRFDEYGNTIKFIRKSNDDSVNDVWISKYKFDKKGNWIEKQKFKNNKPVVIVTRKIEYYE